jgi:putative membrane protein
MVAPAGFLSPEDRDRIRSAIDTAERSTSGEIRVLVVGRSAGPRWIASILLGVAAGAAAGAGLYHLAWGWPELWEWIAAIGLGFCLGAAATWMIPSCGSSRHRAVMRRAEREFGRLKIAETGGSTGVLLMISLREREAVVLADRAISEKAPPETWTREVKAVVEGVRSGHTGDGIVTAVTEIGALLAAHFPRRDDDKNELSDDVVMR